MKYRIRNLLTNELFTDPYTYYLGTNGEIYDSSQEYEPHHIPEFEVQPGFYIGDYVLTYAEGCPMVFQINTLMSMSSVVNDDMTLPTYYLNHEEFEVIDVRN